MWILLFSSLTDESRRRFVSDKELLRAMEEGVKEMSLGIIFPPLAVTRMMALLVPLGPVTLTRPVGKDLIEVAPAMKCPSLLGEQREECEGGQDVPP